MKPLYKYSAETARHNGELDAWRESKKENIRCRDFLDEQIAKRFDGMTLPSDCVENTVKEFGYDRTMWVIANTIQNRKLNRNPSARMFLGAFGRASRTAMCQCSTHVFSATKKAMAGTLKLSRTRRKLSGKYTAVTLME